MKRAMLISITLVLFSCNRERTIISKKFTAMPCICKFDYARHGSGEAVSFEDSCHFYRIGDVAQ